MEIKTDLPKSGNIPSGFYNIPDEAYFASEGLSNSQMGKLLKSPAHYLSEPPAATDAMSFGSLVHTAVLEPDELDARFFVMPKLDLRTKLGKETKKVLEIEQAGKTLVKDRDWDLCTKIKQSVYSHPQASILVETAAHREVAAYKTINGVLCKGKADLWSPDWMGDLKTTKNATAGFGGFTRSVYDFGYHRQAAHYLSVFYDYPEDRSFFFIACEKDAPYSVNVFELTPEYLELGRKQRDKAISMYKDYFTGKKQKNRHMGYDPQVHKIPPPPWIKNDVEENQSIEWDV